MKDVRSITYLSDNEKDDFIKVLFKFEKLFTAKSVSTDTEPYRVRVRPHAQFIQKTHPIPLTYR